MSITNYIHPVQGHECLSACIGNVLNVIYPNIAANEIIIGGDGFFITYERDRKVIGSPMYEANFRFMDKFGMKYVYAKCKDVKEAEAFLDDVLSKDLIIIIKVNAKQLSYSRVFGQATDSSHFINVVRKQGEQYEICDGYVPTRDATVFQGTMEKMELYTAWKKKEFEYLLIETLPDKKESELLEEIERCLIHSAKNYCYGGTNDSIVLGKDAIYEMFVEIQEDIDKSQAYEVNYQLRIYGFLATKEMVCNILKKEEKWQNQALKYAEIVQEWDCICMLFLKAAISGKEDLYEKLLLKVQNCVDAEVVLLNEIVGQEELNAGI